jgi:hypothetical protein
MILNSEFKQNPITIMKIGSFLISKLLISILFLIVENDKNIIKACDVILQIEFVVTISFNIILSNSQIIEYVTIIRIFTIFLYLKILHKNREIKIVDNTMYKL